MYRDILATALAQLAPFWRSPVRVAPIWHNRILSVRWLANGSKAVSGSDSLATYVH